MNRAQVAEELKRVRGELRHFRSLRTKANKDFESTNSPTAQAMVDGADNKIEELRSQESDLLRRLEGGNGSPPAADQGANASLPPGMGVFIPSNFGRFDQEATSILEKIGTTTGHLGDARIPVGTIASAEEVASLTGHAIKAGLTLPSEPGVAQGITYRGIATPPEAPLTLLDVFQSVPLEDRRVEFLKRSGAVAAAGIHSASQFGAIKTEASITYTPEDEQYATIHSWIKVKRQDLMDVGSLERDLRAALSYGVMFKLQDYLLNGHAPDDAFDGLLNTTGVGQPNVSGDNNVSDKILTALGILWQAGVMPNFVALNPITLANEMKRKSAGDGEYFSGGPFQLEVGGTIWRVPTVLAPALSQTTAVIGDSRGAAIGVREGLQVYISQDDQDDRLRNLITVLVEGSFAPFVPTPALFSEVGLA